VKILSILSDIGPAISEPAAKRTSTDKARADEKSRKSTVQAELPPLKEDSSQEGLKVEKRARIVINGQGVALEFSTDPATATVVIRLVDLETNEVIRQIPPEEVLHYLQQVEQLKGALLARTL
jgi:flagellar protein FlaG